MGFLKLFSTILFFKTSISIPWFFFHVIIKGKVHIKYLDYVWFQENFKEKNDNFLILYIDCTMKNIKENKI